MEKIFTGNMSREEWLIARNEGIGGSDCAAILGLNPYKSRYALWAEKTGKIVPEDISDKEAVRLGNDLEEYVANRFTELTGIKHRRYRYILKNPEFPFALANIDRQLRCEGGLEIKTTSSYEYGKLLADGKIPDVWMCQMMHYMMVTGSPYWYLGALVFGKGFYCIKLDRDEEEIAALAAAERDFWALVQSDTPPGVDGSESTTEALRTIYAESSSGRETDLTAVGFHLQAYESLNRQIAELTEQRDAHQAEVMNFMQDAEKGKYGVYSVSWKTQQRKTFDRKAYEQDHGPIGDQYYRVSTSRPFKITVKGK